MLGDCFFAETACRLVGDDNDGDQDGQVRCSKIKVRSIYRTNCTVQYSEYHTPYCSRAQRWNRSATYSGVRSKFFWSETGPTLFYFFSILQRKPGANDLLILRQYVESTPSSITVQP